MHHFDENVALLPRYSLLKSPHITRKGTQKDTSVPFYTKTQILYYYLKRRKLPAYTTLTVPTIARADAILSKVKYTVAIKT